MRQGFFTQQWLDAEGRPAGGVTTGRGFTISWQNGPLGRHTPKCNPFAAGCASDCTRQEPNGAFVEDVIDAAIRRIEFYEASGFACEENAIALQGLYQALGALERRTRGREARGVEGTHTR